MVPVALSLSLDLGYGLPTGSPGGSVPCPTSPKPPRRTTYLLFVRPFGDTHTHRESGQDRTHATQGVRRGRETETWELKGDGRGPGVGGGRVGVFGKVW